ncbi:recombinase family protein [Actinacidiphila sp. bgisy167]|uniref:recombinase family protein n=1 Tax=Actinacidiphila sp. bgisy167 TaxID=3413797 RepID=UPI003D75D97C
MSTQEVDLLLRKSKVVREGEHALSIRAQEERGRRWAATNGYTVRKVWRENLSAYTDTVRPVYDAAMSALQDGEVPALWVYAMDRLSRRGAGAVMPILDAGRRIVFDYEELDSSRPRDRRYIVMRAEDAKEFSDRLAHNVRTTKERQRNEGRWLGKAPYGLRADKGTRRLSPDNEPRVCLVGTRAEVTPWDTVCRIFSAIADGQSGRALARALNAEGIPGPVGAPWRCDSIRAVVVHPVYEGWLTTSGPKKDPVPYTVDGKRVRCADVELIPPDLAERARRVLSGHQMVDSTPRPGRAAHWLTGGVLRCDGCGSALTANSNSYRCNLHEAGAPCPAPVSVKRSSIERYVAEAWAARLNASDPEDPLLPVIAERYAALTRPGETAELRDAMAALKAAEAALEKFHEDDRAGFYAGRSQRFRLPAKQEAEARLDAAEERVAALGTRAVDISLFVSGDAERVWDSADWALKRDLLLLAVDRITVKQGRRGVYFDGRQRVHITWAAQDDDN